MARGGRQTEWKSGQRRFTDSEGLCTLTFERVVGSVAQKPRRGLIVTEDSPGHGIIDGWRVTR